MKKTLFLTVGCPGSGKTTYVNRVMTKLNAWFGLRCMDCSADEYFVGKDGKYNFDRTKLHQAHEYCKDRVRKALRSGCDFVAVSNTSTTHKERLPYIEMAKEWDYRVRIKYIGGVDEESIKLYAQRNIHNVPEESIRRMAERIKSGMKK